MIDFENQTDFLVNLDISSLIDESIYYKVIPRNGTVSSVDGKELKEKLTNAK